LNVIHFGDTPQPDSGVVRHSTATKYSHAEWLAEAERRFGKDAWSWRFVCPACQHIATPGDWSRVKAPETAIAFSCVGRWLPTRREAFGGEGPGPCNYAGAGLFNISPVIVVMPNGEQRPVFAFADAEGGAS
jgi:hypothetical protein